MHDNSSGQMKLVEINGKEILIINLAWRFYAFDENCDHMNARLGSVNQYVVTCPFHGTKLDITSGKKVVVLF